MPPDQPQPTSQETDEGLSIDNPRTLVDEALSMLTKGAEEPQEDAREDTPKDTSSVPEKDTKATEEQAPSSAEPPASEEPEPGSPSLAWAKIKKAEKKLKEERQELKKELHALRQEKEQSSSADTSLKDRMSQDLFGTIQKEFGLTFNDMAQMVIKDQDSIQPKKDQPTEEVAALRAELEELKQQLSNQETRRGINQYAQETQKVLADEKFSALRTMPNALDEVMEYATLYAKEYGEYLQPSDVAGILQDEWVETLKSATSDSAVRQLLDLATDSTDASTQPRQDASVPKTLTRDADTPPPVDPDKAEEKGIDLSKLTPRQAAQRALVFLNQE